MNPWEVLELNKTNDKIEIKKAYTKLLKKFHPEDDPDGFMRLRSAYEEALRQASKNDVRKVQNEPGQDSGYSVISDPMPENQKDNEEKRRITDTIVKPEDVKVPVSDVPNGYINNLTSLYSDLFKRRDINLWRDFFFELSLDEFKHLQSNSCDFFNKNCHLPHDIWKLIDSELSLSNNENFLWPDFTKYDFELTFDCFDPNFKCDYNGYILLRSAAFEAFIGKDYDLAVKKAVEAEKIYDKDPFLFRIMGISSYMAGENDKALTAFSKAISLNSNDCESLMYRGNIMLKKFDFKLAQTDFKAVLDINPKHQDGFIGLIKCSIGLKKYHVANKLIKNLADMNPPNLEVGYLNYKLQQFKLAARIDNFTGYSANIKGKHPIFKTYILPWIVVIIGLPVVYIIMYLFPLIIPPLLLLMVGYILVSFVKG